VKLVDLTLATPAENLACDEALLESCENGGGPEVLRFWQPREHFVVIGYANHVDIEVNRAACEAAGVPIFRRCSGGGTVVQGPGCLNYSLILRISGIDPLRNITTTNQFIMDRNRLALQPLSSKFETRNSKFEISARGHTDLAAGTLKFSGNAQRRRRHALLFHGTFLLEFNLDLIEKLLPMPSKQPDYRAGRPHREFLANLPFSAAAVKAALIEAWGAVGPLDRVPHEQIQSLVRDKYETKEWNFKF